VWDYDGVEVRGFPAWSVVGSAGMFLGGWAVPGWFGVLVVPILAFKRRKRKKKKKGKKNLMW
jgi:hypothetical protein